MHPVRRRMLDRRGRPRWLGAPAPIRVYASGRGRSLPAAARGMERGFGQAAGAVMVVALGAASTFAADAPSFTNVTSGVGLTGRIGYRCAVGDIDGDGYPDLLLHLPSDFGTGDVLNKQVVLVNRPGSDPGDPLSRTFVDFTAASGVRATRAGAPGGHQSDGIVLADVDNDGDLDAFFFVYVHQNWTLPGRNDLMLNDGAGHFTYAPTRPSTPSRSTTPPTPPGSTSTMTGRSTWRSASGTGTTCPQTSSSTAASATGVSPM